MVSWDLSGLKPAEGVGKAIGSVDGRVRRFRIKRKKLRKNTSIESFMQLLKISEDITRRLSRLSSYSYLRRCEDTRDPQNNALEALIGQMCVRSSNDMLFFKLWFEGLSDKQASKLISGSGGYGYLLARIRKTRGYSLTEKEEKIINYKDLSGADTTQRLYDIVCAKFRFKHRGRWRPLPEVSHLARSRNRNERLWYYRNVLSRYSREQDILGELYRSVVQDWNNENVKVRGYKSPISVRNVGNDLPDDTVENMLKSVRENRKLLRRYLKVKSKLAGRDLDRFDIYMPVKEVKGRYDFERSQKIALNLYRGFNKKAGEYAKKMFEERHIHSDTLMNKQSGGFCLSPEKDVTPYILVNHNNRLDDLYTLVHEVGHGIHALAAHKQTNLTYHASLPLAETASLFGEMLLTEKLMAESGEEEKVAVMVRSLDQQFASITRQAYITLFEQRAHEIVNEGASTLQLNKLCLKLLREQFGRSVKVPQLFEIEWAYIPHIFQSPFYCYSYAFGNLVVLSLYEIYKRDEGFPRDYMDLLALGGSCSPADILKKVGIDLGQKSALLGGFKLLKEHVKELASLA